MPRRRLWRWLGRVAGPRGWAAALSAERPTKVPDMAGFQYPDARRLDLAEEIFGHVVRDDYRWLEDRGSPETGAWRAAQDALFAQYAAGLPDRDALAARIGELTRAGAVTPPA